MVGAVLDEVVGYGRVLRDAFTLFSGRCVAGGLEMAVLMAIKVAVEMFIGFIWKAHVPLIIELDLVTVVDWLKYRRIQSWSLRKLFVDIE